MHLSAIFLKTKFLQRIERKTLLLLCLMLGLAWLTLAAQAQTEPVIPVLPAETEEPGTSPGNVPSLENAGQFGQQQGQGDDDPAAAPADQAEQPAAIQPQGGAACPTLVQEAFNASQLVCEGAAPGQACVGNGIVEVTARTDDVTLAQPGDTARFSDLSTLRVRTDGTENNLWAVVEADTQFNTSAGNAASATLVAFGDVNITDRGEAFNPSVRTGTVLATRGMNVRRNPDNQAVVVYQLQGQDNIVVTGITADREWIRMEIPSVYGGIGWVYAPYIDVPGGAETLPTVTQDSPRPELNRPTFGPMQAFSLSSTLYDTCPNVPDSGLLMQSQSGTSSNLRVRINGAELAYNGTVYIQAVAGQTMTITVLEGDAILIAGGSEQSANGGDQLTVTIDNNLEATGRPQISGVALATFEGLPVGLLPRRFAVSGTGDVDSQPAQPAQPPTDTGGQAQPPTATGTGDTGAGQPPADGCVISAESGDRELRGGPGVNYSIVGSLQQGQSVEGTGVAVSATGDSVWYETTQGWVPITAVTTSSACQSLPPVAAPPPG